MYFCLTLLAGKLEVNTIKGISNAFHVYQNEEKSKNKITFSYDTFWQELGGQKNNEEAVWFDLPRCYLRKTLDEIGRKKRGQYRKRYALMDQIEQEMDISK